jgi:hypothetical protein
MERADTTTHCPNPDKRNCFFVIPHMCPSPPIGDRPALPNTKPLAILGILGITGFNSSRRLTETDWHGSGSVTRPGKGEVPDRTAIKAT